MTWFKASLILGVLALLLSLVKIKPSPLQWFQERAVELLLMIAAGTFTISFSILMYRSMP